MPLPPTGTVTFLFTDIQGSTKLWENYPDTMRPVLARHDDLLRRHIETHQGYVFKTIGDAFCAAFPTAPDALQAALTAQIALCSEVWDLPAPLLVRMGLHSGDCEERDGDYFGQPVNRVARLMAAGHGGQILLSGAVQALLQNVPDSVTFLDLGQRRLKDLGRPEHVFQLCHSSLPAGFPPLKSLDNPELPNNLPQQVTSFIGREKQVGEVKELLAQTRLLTLLGGGGAGKTRLSLQVAADLLDRYFDGVWLVELAALSEPDLVAQAVAEVLGVKEQAGQSLPQTLVEALKEKRMLLVLDNCEHLVAACASLAALLLRSCPGICLLTSSREPLNVPGEQSYRVPSLAQAESVRLFTDRAQAVQQSFTLTDANMSSVVQICARLDGIPLAIELASARVRSLSVQEISQRLDSRFRLLTGGNRTALPRQQTLRALMDWSYNLLTDAEKSALCRLSVFAGGWTLAAAEEVCAGDSVEDFEVLDLLTSLVDKSLVIYTEEERYGLLETVREYSRDRLGERGELTAAQERAAAWFLKLVKEAEEQLYGAEQAVWMARLETELDNLRASLSWYEQHPEGSEAGLSLSKDLSRFWMVRGHLTEGRQWLERGLRRIAGRETAMDQRFIMQVYHVAGLLALMQSDFAVAEAMLQEVLTICRREGYPNWAAAALSNLGIVAMKQADFTGAQRLFQESLAIYREIGSGTEIAGALNNLGDTAKNQGNDDEAQSLFEEGLVLAEQGGNVHLIAMLRDNLGTLALRRNDFVTARSLLAESLNLKRQLGDQWGMAYSLDNMAGMALAQEHPAQAAPLLAAAFAARSTLGAHLPAGDQVESDKRTAAARAALGDEAFSAAWAQGLSLTIEQAVEYALTGGQQ